MFNILLQVLDDGRITDSQGRTVDFKNTIIILTSNLGSSYLLEGIKEDGSIEEEAVKEVDSLLKQSFRPEFLNRLDEIVYYKPLMKNQIYNIIDLMIEDLQKRLDNKQIKLEVTDAAKQYIADNGYDQNFGARPLKRFIKNNVETLVAKKIISGAVEAGDIIVINVDEKNNLIIQ